MENIIAIGLIIMLILNIILIIRNNKVYQYRSYIIQKCYDVCTAHLYSIPNFEYTQDEQEYHQYLRQIWQSISDVSYDKMWLKFWIPLKDKYWFTEEQIKFLNLTFPKHDTRR